MDVSVTEVARRLDVSPRRVRGMISAGALSARKVSSRWLIDEASLHRSAKVARPMSPRVAWAFITLISGGEPATVSQPEQSRLRAKHRQLLAAGDDAPLLLRSWLPERALLFKLSAAPEDVPDLLADVRLVPSGISDPRSGTSAAAQAEGYVTDADTRRARSRGAATVQAARHDGASTGAKPRARAAHRADGAGA